MKVEIRTTNSDDDVDKCGRCTALGTPGHVSLARFASVSVWLQVPPLTFDSVYY